MNNYPPQDPPLKVSCNRRMFLLGTATTFAGAFLAACGSDPTAELEAATVPVGSGVIVGSFIIAQPREGYFLAFSSTCPHQHNPITEIDGAIARCTSHDSEFSLLDGSVVAGPSRDPLTPSQINHDSGTLRVKNLPRRQ